MTSLDKKVNSNSVETASEHPSTRRDIEMLDKDIKLLKYEILEDVRKHFSKWMAAVSTITVVFLTLFAFVGFDNMRDSIIKQIDIESLKKEALESVKTESKEYVDSYQKDLISDINKKVEVFNEDLGALSKDIQVATDAIVTRASNVNTTKNVLNSAPIGWAFHSQKFSGDKYFSQFAFLPEKKTVENNNQLFPRIGDIVKCNRDLLLVRTGVPNRSIMKPTVGSLARGDKVKIIEVEDIYDSRKNLEVWVKIEPL